MKRFIDKILGRTGSGDNEEEEKSEDEEKIEERLEAWATGETTMTTGNGPDPAPLVSVIVTTKDEEEHIERCLQAVKDQSYDETELIVVDNDSTDSTKEIALRHADEVYDKGPERSAQRNHGVEKSEGKYVMYLDADMRLSEEVVKQCVEKCETEGKDALFVPEQIVGEGFWVKVRDFERSFYDATPIDCVRFIRKSLFQEVGGFDEDLTGPEDWDLDRRIREEGEVDIIDAPLYHDEGRFSFREYLSGKEYYMQDFDKYVEKWGEHDPVVKKQLGPRYRLIGVFTEDGNWKELLKHPLLSTGMYFLRAVVGASYLKRGLIT